MFKRLDLYEHVHELLTQEKFSEVGDILHSTLFEDRDYSMTMGLLRLTFNWKHQIANWKPIAKENYRYINNAEILMRGLLDDFDKEAASGPN